MTKKVKYTGAHFSSTSDVCTTGASDPKLLCKACANLSRVLIARQSVIYLQGGGTHKEQCEICESRICI